MASLRRPEPLQDKENTGNIHPTLSYNLVGKQEHPVKKRSFQRARDEDDDGAEKPMPYRPCAITGSNKSNAPNKEIDQVPSDFSLGNELEDHKKTDQPITAPVLLGCKGSHPLDEARAEDEKIMEDNQRSERLVHERFSQLSPLKLADAAELSLGDTDAKKQSTLLQSMDGRNDGHHVPAQYPGTFYGRPRGSNVEHFSYHPAHPVAPGRMDFEVPTGDIDDLSTTSSGPKQQEIDLVRTPTHRLYTNSYDHLNVEGAPTPFEFNDETLVHETMSEPGPMQQEILERPPRNLNYVVADDDETFSPQDETSDREQGPRAVRYHPDGTEVPLEKYRIVQDDRHQDHSTLDGTSTVPPMSTQPEVHILPVAPDIEDPPITGHEPHPPADNPGNDTLATKRKVQKFMVPACVGFLIIVIVVIIAVTVLKKGDNIDPIDNGDDEASAEQRATKLKNIIGNIINSQLLENDSTPQALAYNWIINEDKENISVGDEFSDIRVVARYVMAVLYFTLNNTPAEWLQSDKHECDWPHVECESGLMKTIEGVGVTNNLYQPLSGKLPDELRHISTLKEIDLRSNDITGFGLLPLGLEKLLLSKNEIKNIPDIFEGMGDLLALDFHGNKLTGMPPPSFSGLTRLEELHLGENSMKGNLSTELHPLTDLKVLSLYGNDFSGTLSDILREMRNLEYIDVHGNPFSGTIGAEFGFRPFKTIFISKTKLHGTIPPQIGNLNKLSTLRLSSNLFSGDLPSELWTITSLEVITISNENVTGQLASTIGTMSNLGNVVLENVPFSGTIPSEIGLLGKLSQLFITRTDITGTIPSELGELDETLKNIQLYDNNLSGPIPNELSSLTHLFFTESLPLFDISGNSLLTGTVPQDECPVTMHPCQIVFDCDMTCEVGCICN